MVKSFKRVRGEYHAGPVEITIYPDRKEGVMPDGLPYPALLRSTVPNLTDAEWYSAPNENWDEQRYWNNKERMPINAPGR